MQDLEDDMDEFIRKAARDYPFRLQEDGWSYVAEKIDSTGATGFHQPIFKFHAADYRKILVSMFLILLSGFLFLMSEVHSSKIQEKKIVRGIKSPDVTNDGGLKDMQVACMPKPILKTTISSHETDHSGLNEQLVENAKLVNNYGIERKEIRSASLIQKRPDSIAFHTLSLEFETATKSELPERHLQNKKTLFYLGLIAGPQFNQINDQGLSHAGWSLGVLAGWQISKKLSLESGVNFTQKQYNTSGEYFNMQGVSGSMPPGMKIVSLVGKSYVTEIPLMLKYDVLTSGNSRIFVSGGISSYILTKETNQYKIMLNGSAQKMTGNYTKTSGYYMASANFSAGYENQVSHGIRIRVAPYVQVPMAGFGVGALRILSAGVNLGATVPLIRK